MYFVPAWLWPEPLLTEFDIQHRLESFAKFCVAKDPTETEALPKAYPRRKKRRPTEPVYETLAEIKKDNSSSSPDKINPSTLQQIRPVSNLVQHIHFQHRTQ